MAILAGVIRVFVLIFVLGLAAEAQALACIKPRELQADQVRFVELQLKIGALRCRFETPELAALYNRFVLGKRLSLRNSGRLVEVYLARRTSMNMDTYVTRRANEISRDSLAVQGFCKQTKEVALQAISTTELPQLSYRLPVPYQAPDDPVCDMGNAKSDSPKTAIISRR